MRDVGKQRGVLGETSEVTVARARTRRHIRYCQTIALPGNDLLGFDLALRASLARGRREHVVEVAEHCCEDLAGSWCGHQPLAIREVEHGNWQLVGFVHRSSRVTIIQRVNTEVAGVAAQPHMAAAVVALREARRQPWEAAANKGGHRARALEILQRAIGQIRDGIGFAATHG